MLTHQSKPLSTSLSRSHPQATSTVKRSTVNSWKCRLYQTTWEVPCTSTIWPAPPLLRTSPPCSIRDRVSTGRGGMCPTSSKAGPGSYLPLQYICLYAASPEHTPAHLYPGSLNPSLGPNGQSAGIPCTASPQHRMHRVVVSWGGIAAFCAQTLPPRTSHQTLLLPRTHHRLDAQSACVSKKPWQSPRHTFKTSL